MRPEQGRHVNILRRLRLVPQALKAHHITGRRIVAWLQMSWRCPGGAGMLAADSD